MNRTRWISGAVLAIGLMAGHSASAQSYQGFPYGYGNGYGYGYGYGYGNPYSGSNTGFGVSATNQAGAGCLSACSSDEPEAMNNLSGMAGLFGQTTSRRPSAATLIRRRRR